MIIKSLELENIRSYKNEIVTFDSGVNFLSGDIGSGKSTILLAIEFALFGFKKGDLEGFQLLRKGEREGSVKLILADNDEDFEVYRKVKKAKSKTTISQENGYVKFKGNLIELSPQEITSTVFEELNFPKEFITKDKNLIYRFTTYTPQEQLKEIIYSQIERRLEVIRKLFKIDKYKNLKDSVSIFNSYIREKKILYKTKLESKSEIESNLKELKSEVLNMEKKLESTIPKRNLINENLGKIKLAINKKNSEIEKLFEEISKVKSEINLLLEIEKKIKEYEEDLEIKRENLEKNKKLFRGEVMDSLKLKKDKLKTELEKIKDFENKISIKEKEVEKLVEKREEIKENLYIIKNKKIEISSLKESFDYTLTLCRIKDLKNNLKSLEAKKKSFENIKISFDEKQKEVMELSTKVKILNEKIKDKKEQLDNISNLDECTLCLQKVEHSHKSDIKEKITKDIRSVENELKGLNTKLKLLEKEFENKKILEVDSNDFLEEYTQTNTNLNLLLERQKEEEIKYKKLKKLEVEVQKLNEKKLEDELKKLNEEIGGFNFKEKYEMINERKTKLIELENSIEMKISEVKNSKDKVIEIEKEIEILNSKISLEKKRLSKKSQLQKDLEKLNKEENSLKNSKSVFEEKKEKNEKLEREVLDIITSIKTLISDKTKLIDDSKKKIEELNKVEKDFENIIFLEDFILNRVINVSNSIEQAIFTKYYVEFNEAFESYFKELIEDNNIDVRLDEEFSPIVEQNGYDIDLKNLSGGERSSLAIAYRLALKRIIESNLSKENKLNFTILDEPTDGFSNEQIDRLGEILKGSNLDQIIIVSHDEKIESIAENIINIEKVNHISKVV